MAYRAGAVLCVVLLPFGCASADDVTVPQAQSAADALQVEPVPQTPVSRTIVTVASRDMTLRISTGPQGLRFRVTDSASTTLSEDLDESSLAARYPELHRWYESAVANGVYWDARHDPPRRAEGALSGDEL